MRSLILQDLWKKENAVFEELYGAQSIKSISSFEEEYDAIRKKALFADFSFCKRYVFDESDGLDFLDTILAENVLTLRYGRVLDTFLADDSGNICAECFVANISDKIYLFAESIADENYLDSIFSKCPSCKDITNETVLLSVDGPEAWRVAKDICGQDILDLPYLSIENFKFENTQIQLLRKGTTGEFGYQFLAPLSVAEKLFDTIKNSTLAIDGKLGGTDIHFNARLEGNFFNIYAEGVIVKNPLALGLQWMIDFDKENFNGSKSIFANREKGISTALVGIKHKTAGNKFSIGDEIFNESECVGEVVACAYSKISDCAIALVLFEKEYGLSGFEYSSKASQDRDLLTISMPPIVALSLQNGMNS